MKLHKNSSGHDVHSECGTTEVGGGVGGCAVMVAAPCASGDGWRRDGHARIGEGGIVKQDLRLKGTLNGPRRAHCVQGAARAWHSLHARYPVWWVTGCAQHEDGGAFQ